MDTHRGPKARQNPDLLTEALDMLDLDTFGGKSLFFPRSTGVLFPGQVKHPRAQRNVPSKFALKCSRPPDGIFHILIQGRCTLHVDGIEMPISLAPGDLALVLHGRAHRLLETPNASPRPIGEWVEERFHNPKAPFTAAWGIIGGGFFCASPTASRIVHALPPIIHVPKHQAQSSMWIDELLGIFTHEGGSTAPGSRAVVNRIVHLLFILAVRNSLAILRLSTGNWLNAVLNSDIGPALALIHNHPGRRWTVTTLAEEISMSRSAFAAKFNDAVGQPPLQYLTQHRMDTAKALLESGGHSLKEIAVTVGYLSEAAFSNAFRRHQGVPPGKYRKQTAGLILSTPLGADCS